MQKIVFIYEIFLRNIILVFMFSSICCWPGSNCVETVDVSSVPDSLFIKFDDAWIKFLRESDRFVIKNPETSYGTTNRFVVGFRKRPVSISYLKCFCCCIIRSILVIFSSNFWILTTSII